MSNLRTVLLNKYGESYMEYEYIDEDKLFLKNGVNIVYGDKCVGKTTSTIMCLNKSGVVPILLDYDYNPKIDGCQYDGIKGSNIVLQDVIDNGTGDDVVIIDHLDGFSGGRYMDEKDATIISQKLRELANVVTVILLAHATVLRTAGGRTSEYFRGSDKISNTSDTVYRLSRESTLYTEKRRGSVMKDIEKWMRG